MMARLPVWVADVTGYVENILRDRALLSSVALQMLFIIAALAAVSLLRPRISRTLDSRLTTGTTHFLIAAIVRIVPWASLWLILWFGRLAFHEAGRHTKFLQLAENLALAWVVIRFTSGLVRNPTIASGIAIAAWGFAALNILGLVEPTVHLLDDMSITIGHLRLSVLLLLKGAMLLAALLWVANVVSRLLDRRLQSVTTMAPAMRMLTAKLVKIALLTLAVVVALNTVGIDLTAFAFFTGTIGVGVGFGLQKVVSNLVSGVILLLDRSIKLGDVIEIAGTYGWITRFNARFISVSTRDGIEYLIPNEDLITQRVTNWSYSNDNVRLHVPVGISYQADVRAAMQICLDAAKAVPRVLDTPASLCLLKGFGDSTINLELRFWIRDPRNGTANVRSDVMLGIWDGFRANGIEFPFPQRDIHLPDIDGVIEKLGAQFAGRSTSPARKEG